LNKVKSCLQNILPQDVQDKDFQIDNLAGTYGNPIRAITIKYHTQQMIHSIITKITSLMPPEIKLLLINEFSQRLDEKNKFYFRINKQLLAIGKFELAQGSDVIRIIISIENRNPKVHVDSNMVFEYLKKVGFF
jgi:RNA binding exosome subunit